MGPSRRDVLKLGGATIGASLLARRSKTAVAASTPPAPVTPSAGSLTISALQAFLQANASATFSLPPTMIAPPTISWAGAITATPVATSIAGGVTYPASSGYFGGPIRQRFLASLPGGPSIGGIPALAVSRAYTCQGVARTVGSPTVLRFSTDAPVFELAGVIPAGNFTSQTLIVDGQVVPAHVLSVSNAAEGGYNAVGIRVDFGSRAMRDIWLETGIHVAYLTVGQADTMLAATDAADPQITVVGDSYLGYASSAFGNGAGLGLEIGVRLGLGKVAVDSVYGSGYWTSGYNRGNFNDRVMGHAADNSNIYLVMGGLDDYFDPYAVPQSVWPTSTQYQGAVTGYFQALRAAQPGAVIVATAPFCPNPTLSDSTYVQNALTNASGLGDFAFKSQIQRTALTQVSGPWLWIDVLMGSGWLNSSGISGGASGLQWLTGGTAASGTTANNKSGNPGGGSGGGFGGIASIPILSGGSYSQAPDIIATGGSGSGLLLAATIDSSGAVNAITIISPGVGYTSGAGLPMLRLDSTFAHSAAVLGAPTLISGINPDGVYPPGTASALGGSSNAYVMLLSDLTYPSPAGVDYFASRLAQSVYEGIMAL